MFSKRLLLILVASSMCWAQTEPKIITPTKKIKLFNGKNLDGWYTWLTESRYDDPKKVFSVKDGMIRVSGEEWGGLGTKDQYRDYHLTVEWKWGTLTHGKRANAARDSGILVHGVGEDGAYNKTWLESIESQIIEGGVGDFIMVGGKNQPSLTAEVREGPPPGQLYWQKGGKLVTRNRGRFNWFDRDPEWKDVKGFRGAKDVEKPAGEWNRQEVIYDGDTLANIINGVTVNYGTKSSHTAGKIQLQSEGAEIFFRKVELQPVNRRSSSR